SGLLDALMRASVPARREVLRSLPEKDIRYLLVESTRELGTAFGLWHDAPAVFVEDVLDEAIWSKQREILNGLTTYKRLAVPAGFGVGKTWIAGRAVAWAGAVNPPGTVVIVTTATRFRQVRYQLWPHIRKVVARSGLPGATDTTQWKIPDQHGNDVVAAYGFTAPDNDEAAMQGIHGTPKLLLVVDEAGGISRIIGGGTNNLLTGDARMLAIGNPAMNDPRSWFELLCEEGDDPDEPTTGKISIASLDSPAITGEVTPICRDCAHNPDGHRVTVHLPDQDWVDRTIREYGSVDHPYVISKVFAQFPKDGGSQVNPTSWVESAIDSPDREGDGWVRLCDLGLDGEADEFTVAMGSWVRLGVDVAADGGDEFAIYRCVGDVIHHRHTSVGAQNSSQVTVAERILEEIHAAERLAKALRSPRPVRVKVDKNGLGHGAVGMLERWADIGSASHRDDELPTGSDGRRLRRHHSEIVGVMVSESPERDDPGAPLRPRRKRDEMWIAMRQLLQPDPSSGLGRIRLRVDHKCRVQLSTPRLGNDAGGLAVVESKKSMRERGVDSPDRAEASCLSVYEPFPIIGRKKRGLLN
ncbi:MAG TPA: hypothetical protein VFP72_02995, partial [Kineosporiaceae bacterium]|nr:hypothetical protein [Kineosporiaceae bacterium]